MNLFSQLCCWEHGFSRIPQLEWKICISLKLFFLIDWVHQFSPSSRYYSEFLHIRILYPKSSSVCWRNSRISEFHWMRCVDWIERMNVLQTRFISLGGFADRFSWRKIMSPYASLCSLMLATTSSHFVTNDLLPSILHCYFDFDLIFLVYFVSFRGLWRSL